MPQEPERTPLRTACNGEASSSTSLPRGWLGSERDELHSQPGHGWHCVDRLVVPVGVDEPVRGGAAPRIVLLVEEADAVAVAHRDDPRPQPVVRRDNTGDL